MNYTDRVELCEDGLYRWYYDLDMRKDHRMITTPLKVLAVIGLFMLVMVQFLPYHSGGMSRWRVMGILAACFALITAITLGICLIQYLARRGYYRYRFEMGPEGVRVLMDEGGRESPAGAWGGRGDNEPFCGIRYQHPLNHAGGTKCRIHVLSFRSKGGLGQGEGLH